MVAARRASCGHCDAEILNPPLRPSFGCLLFSIGWVSQSYPAAPIVGALVFLAFAIQDGFAESNRFGPDPKGRTGNEEPLTA